MKTSLKKTLRDIKSRWLQFAAIIVVLSLGASMYYGLSSMTSWREDSLDYTYSELLWEDLQIDLIAGSYIDPDVLHEQLIAMNEYDLIEAIEFRLVLTTAVNISTGDQFTIIPGNIIGTNISFIRPVTNDNYPEVNKVELDRGRYFNTSETNLPVAIAERRLFDNYDIDLGDNLTLFTPSGTQDINLIGSATIPDYLLLIDEKSIGLFSEKQFTVLEMPLSTLQEIYHIDKAINQIILRCSDKERINELKSAIESKMDEVNIAVTVFLGELNIPYMISSMMIWKMIINSSC